MTDKVTSKDNSKERVAYDLMLLIATKEVQNTQQQQARAIFEQQQEREYWLKLYGQCHSMTDSANQDYRDILQDQDRTNSYVKYE